MAEGNHGQVEGEASARVARSDWVYCEPPNPKRRVLLVSVTCWGQGREATRGVGENKNDAISGAPGGAVVGAISGCWHGSVLRVFRPFVDGERHELDRHCCGRSWGRPVGR